MSFLDWVYPPKCMACGRILPVQEKEQRKFKLCGRCRVLFEKIAPPFCKKCGSPLEDGEIYVEPGTSGGARGFFAALPGAGCPACFSRGFSFESNRSFFPYGGVLRDILLDIKFHSRKQSAAGLGELWASVIAPEDFSAEKFSRTRPFLVPVPMYPRKARARGFNQAEVLAAAVAKKTGVEMKKDLLKRAVDTPPQSGLTPKGRAENVRGVFKLNGRYNIEGTEIILIDDIFTTGASLNACAEILIEGGAGKVSCMTLAVAVKNKEKI